MDDETLQDALDYCLANSEEMEMEELLSKFPESREELVPLLALCGLISEAVPPVPQERREAIKGRFLDAATATRQSMVASANGHGVSSLATTMPVVSPEPTAQPAQPVSVPGKVRVEKERQRRSFIFDWLTRPAFGAAFAALLIAFVWVLSASSLPDSPFYSVRMLGESIAVNVQTSPEARVLKHNELAGIRLREIEEMDRRGKLAQSGRAFEDYADHLSKGRDILSGTQLNEQQQARLAKALYATSTEGEIELDRLDDQGINLPQSVRETLAETQQVQHEVRDYSADVLEKLGDPPLDDLPPATQDVLRQTPGPDATTLADLVPQTATSSGATATATATPTRSNGSNGRATATARAVDRTATSVAGSLASTATAVPTNTVVPSATATSTHTTVPTATYTYTPIPAPSATPTLTSEPSPLASTATPTTRPGATVTPPRGQPTSTRTSTRTPQVTRTPGRPPTHTPAPEKTKKPDPEDTPTMTATPTATDVPPTSTPVPPSETPLPDSTTIPSSTPTEKIKDKDPTNTPKPKEPTNTPKPREEPTDTPEPTEEPSGGDPSSAPSVCDVEVKDVSAGCASGDCVEWSAQLNNKATEAIEVSWVAEMRVEVAGVAPMTYVDSGAKLVRPGEEEISGTFCEDLPPQTKKIRITVRTDTGSSNCDSRKQSRSIDPCRDDDRGTKPTAEIVPTKPPIPTELPIPTVELFPTKTPKSR